MAFAPFHFFNCWRKTMTWLHMKAFAPCVVLLALSAPSALGKEKQPAGKGIDAATVAAYEKLGAEYGGWVKTEYGFRFQAGRDHAEKGLPGFRFVNVFPMELPEVAVPFGLDLFQSNVKDAGLKEVARHKNLVALSLYGTYVTDVGMKELAGLKNLAALQLAAHVTPAGLKELAGLESIVSIDMSSLTATPAGLKELANFKSLASLGLRNTNMSAEALKELAGLESIVSI